MDIDDLTLYLNRNCSTLTDLFHQFPDETRVRLLWEFLDSANPRAAAGRIEDLLHSAAPETVATILEDRDLSPPFLATVSGSRFLASILIRNPALVEPFFVAGGYLVRKTRQVKESELASRIAAATRTEDLDRILRLYKEEEYLRIGAGDLAGVTDVQQVMGELSDLAAACTDAAVKFHWKRLLEKHGLPPLEGEGIGFVVMGMGKVSGRELNFSSDLDLIFLREPEEGRTAGPESVTVVKFYETLARSVTRSLSDITEDGFVLRVDLRLRPEGDKGELVPSLNNAVDYYLGWGRTWERAALMKALPLAGDIALGNAFLEELEPFIYRKYLDYSTIEDMRGMKIQIESHLKRKPGVDIKLGQGGIREIEFFVQTLQLINAGRTPRVRSASTLEALGLLHETGLLDSATVRHLRSAYLFFRTTEHRIQITHQVQTHELPRTREDQEELARRMGYRRDPLDAFLADLDRHRKVVDELFSSLFRQQREELGEAASPDVKRIVQAIHDEQATCEIFSELGFADAASSYPILKSLLLPSEERFDTDRGRLLLERLGPLFLDEVLKAPEPATALAALDRYIDSLHAASGYFSTFLENPATVRFLIRIFGESRFFTDLLIHHPQSIDSLIGRGSLERPREKEALEAELAQRLAYYEGYERELDILRRFKHEEILRIGVSQFSGDIDSLTARWLVTELAEVCLAAAVEIATKEMARRFGVLDFLEDPPLVILGMGKLGGREMTYLSDLDVIFIYEAPHEQIGRFSAHEWFTRLASRIISILSVATAEGTVFDIDTRLRPSGNKGPLVSSIDSFREYHQTTSELWEKQALIKARPITGPQRLVQDVAEIVKDCVRRTAMTDEVLAEIARLRRRMQDELAMETDEQVDLKTGYGGMVDVEFFVQGNILQYSKEFPAVLCSNTLEALTTLRQEGLIKEDVFQTLSQGYRFLANLEDRLRIMEHRSIDRMPLSGEKLKGLARRIGYGENGEDLLVSDYRRITRSIREIYESFFGADGSDSAG